MDQVKVALAVLKKHHFWVLLGVVLVVGLVIWHTAAASLSEEFTKRKTELEGKKKAVAEIASAQNPPNLEVVKAIQQSHDMLREKVYRAWQYLYGLQQQTNPWPNLGPEFGQMIAQLTAEELKNPDAPPEIPVEFREVYWNFIKTHLETLRDIIDARRPKLLEEFDEPGKKTGEKGDAKAVADATKEGAAGDPKDATQTAKKTVRKTPMMPGAMPGMMPGAMPGMMPGGSPEAGGTMYGAGGMAMEMTGVVDWLDEPAVLARFAWQTTPTTEQVRLAQEDLWVYEALLRIIAVTNHPAKTQYAAAVKRIFNLEIGQQAAAAFLSGRQAMGGGMMGSGGYPGMPGMTGYPGMPGSTGMPPGYPSGSAPSGSGSPGGSAPGGSPEGGSMPGMMGPGTITPGQMARHFRYVDTNGVPLAADATPPFAEFKMMPVRMYLLVDQRRLPKLLAACANSSMPVEVRQIRLRPEQGGIDFSALSAGMSGATTGYPGMPGMPGGMPGYPGGSPGMSGYPGGSPGMSGYPGGSPGMPDYPGGSPGMPGYPGGSPGMSGYPGGSPGMSGYPGGSPGMSGYPGGSPGSSPDAPGGAYSRTMGGAGAVSSAEDSFDLPVEILGVIYIFNPPNRSKLGTGAVTVATAAGAAAPDTGAPPAAATPATPAAPAAPTAPPTAPGTAEPPVPAAGGPGAAAPGPAPAAPGPPGPAPGATPPAPPAAAPPGAPVAAPAAPGKG